MMKRILALLFAFVFLFCVIFPITSFADGSPVRSSKVVSVVYDDSGSMEGDKWIYANYAMQAFTAMLNDNDSLYITYMSQPGKSVSVDTSDLQNSVNTIRSHDYYDMTPVGSLDTAFNALLDEDNRDPNTQYWLVVFTDGGYNEIETDKIPEEVGNKLAGYADTDMPNGTKPHIFNMSIYDTENEFTPLDKGKQNVDIVKADSTEDIFEQIFLVSSQVSGRFKVEQKDITVDSDNQITVHADLPLFNIGVLTQNTQSKVSEITNADGEKIPLKSDVDINAPDESVEMIRDYSHSSEALAMHGSAVLAGYSDKVMPAGVYKITFTDAIDPKDYTVLLEPAIELRITLLQDGSVTEDYDNITGNQDGLSAKAALYEYGTDTEILSSLLPNGIKYNMIHSEDGVKKDEQPSNELKSITVTTGENTISALAELPGYFSLTAALTFTCVDVNIEKIEAEILPDGSPRMPDSNGNPDGDEVVYLSKLPDNKTGVLFRLYEDGEPIDEDRAKALKSRFEAGLKIDYKSFLSGGYEVEVQPDGTYLVYPHQDPGWTFFYNSLIAYALNNGTHEVKSTAFDVEASESLTFKLGPMSIWDIIGDIFKIILPIYLIIWFVFKKHFPRATFSCYELRRRANNVTRYDNYKIIKLGWFGARGLHSPNKVLWQFINFLLPIPSSFREDGLAFHGQKLFFNGDYSLKVTGVKGKFVDTTPNPPEAYDSSDVIMSDELYHKNGSKQTMFKVE